MPKLPRLNCVTDRKVIVVEKRVPELRRVPADKPVQGILVCTGPYHMPTHWVGNRTQICAGEGQCEHCPHVGIKHYFLVALLDKHNGEIAWYALTDQAADSLLYQMEQLQRPFFGSLVRLGRERKTMKAPQTVTVDSYSSVQGRLPKPQEPTETLERVFNSPRSGRKAPAKVL